MGKISHTASLSSRTRRAVKSSMARSFGAECKSICVRRFSGLERASMAPLARAFIPHLIWLCSPRKIVVDHIKSVIHLFLYSFFYLSPSIFHALVLLPLSVASVSYVLSARSGRALFFIRLSLHGRSFARTWDRYNNNSHTLSHTLKRW